MEGKEQKDSKMEAEFFVPVDCPPSPSLKQAGPFWIGRFLGKGTSGTAFVGTHIESGFKAALKVIKKANLAKKPARWKLLKREIAVMKLMDHPNVLKLYDVFESEDKIFMVTELARGGELFDYLQKGVPSRKTVLRFLAQITMGLLHCHQHGIAHRDLKPENLLLDERINIKIADFGMARYTAKGASMSTTCGSPHYVSPEVISGNYEGKSSDVWSLGVILYALATGCLPFDHQSIPELLKLIQAGVYKIPTDVEDDIADLIRKMMQLNVKERIKMEDIQFHPAFAATWYFSKIDLPCDIPVSMESFQAIDEAVFEDLVALLGADARMEIRSSLTQPGDSIEKSLYKLLINRKGQRLVHLNRLSPKISPRPSPSFSTRSVSELSNSSSGSPLSMDLPAFDLGGVTVEAKDNKETKPSLLQSNSKPEISESLSHAFGKVAVEEKSESSPSATYLLPSGTTSSCSSSPVSSPRRLREGSRGPHKSSSRSRRSEGEERSDMVGQSPQFQTRRIDSFQSPTLGTRRISDPSAQSPKYTPRRISIQVDPESRDLTVPRPVELQRASSDIKPTPTSSPRPSPRPSPRESPRSSPMSSPSSSPSTSRTPSPSTRTRSPTPTRPWFAAFFKRRPSMDPYKADVTSPVTPARSSILRRLRARTSQSPKRLQLDLDQSSPRPLIENEIIRDERQHAIISAKLEGLQQATSKAHSSPPLKPASGPIMVPSSPFASFRKSPLPALREESESGRDHII